MSSQIIKADKLQLTDGLKARRTVLKRSVADANEEARQILEEARHYVENVKMIKHYGCAEWLLSVEEVDRIVHSMKKGKAGGIDDVTLEHLIFAHPTVIVHLTILFNLMLLHDFVPSKFGLGIIVPLLKDRNGNISQLSNYKGFTLSSVISKLFSYLSVCYCLPKWRISVCIITWSTFKLFPSALPVTSQFTSLEGLIMKMLSYHVCGQAAE
ncbi:MAG: hypothetical protein MUC29_05045 [Pyrinomonadaceae bacterium]|nr:hypothetical protein [Pyrinomonadaceae bacterium]